MASPSKVSRSLSLTLRAYAVAERGTLSPPTNLAGGASARRIGGVAARVRKRTLSSMIGELEHADVGGRRYREGVAHLATKPPCRSARRSPGTDGYRDRAGRALSGAAISGTAGPERDRRSAGGIRRATFGPRPGCGIASARYPLTAHFMPALGGGCRLSQGSMLAGTGLLRVDPSARGPHSFRGATTARPQRHRGGHPNRTRSGPRGTERREH